MNDDDGDAMLEIDFRLDSNGRTVSKHETDGKTYVGHKQQQLDYTTRSFQAEAWMMPLASPPSWPTSSNNGDGSSGNNDSSSISQQISHDSQLWSELLLDCQIADNGLMPRTFWMPATERSGRFYLEQMAADIFHHHTQHICYNAATSGAEWWVQLRPSPPAGRYTMHDHDDGDGQQQGVTLHWDKDEELRIVCGGTVYVHPHLSTVTYLTNVGAPTMVVPARIHALTGEWKAPGDDENRSSSTVDCLPFPEAWISWPRIGKHLVFDGRYLHAAPPDLMAPGAWTRQINDQTVPSRQRRRITFLVNIWLHHVPLQVARFPMPEKMSGYNDGNSSNEKRSPLLRLTIPDRSDVMKSIRHNDDTGSADSSQPMSWTLGNAADGERLQVARLPLPAIRDAAASGQTCHVIGNAWQLLRNINDAPSGLDRAKKARIDS